MSVHETRKTGLTAGIYARVSSEEQARKGYSIDYQIDQCRRHAERLGATSSLIFTDQGVSGAVLSRPGLSALRKAVKQGAIQMVVVLDPDRFARNIVHQLLVTEEIERKNIRLEFVNFEWKNTPEGQLFYAIRGAVAQYEKEKIRERTMYGRLQKAKAGKLPHAHRPYGYDYDHAEAALVINEPEARVVRYIFHLFTDLLWGFSAIARHLNKRGIPTKKGRGPWHRMVIKQILSNPVYTGTFFVNRYRCKDVGLNKYKPPSEKVKPSLRAREEWIPVPVPPIISYTQWEKAQARMSQIRRLQQGYHKRQYLLSGLLQCGYCGGKLYGHQTTKKNRSYAYYYCRQTASSGKKCGLRIKAEHLEKIVWDQVKTWLDDPAAFATIIADTLRHTSDYEVQLQNINSQLARLQAARRILYHLLEYGEMPESQFPMQLKQITARIIALENEKSRLSKITSSAPNMRPEKMAFSYLAQLDNLPFPRRQLLVRRLIEKIVIENKCNAVIYARVSPDFISCHYQRLCAYSG
ncbi:MAG: recombinase family protein [Peptococcaceae bacterium]|nr:recombinase family protein [Peptococcaceae bacterium]